MRKRKLPPITERQMFVFNMLNQIEHACRTFDAPVRGKKGRPSVDPLRNYVIYREVMFAQKPGCSDVMARRLACEVLRDYWSITMKSEGAIRAAAAKGERVARQLSDSYPWSLFTQMTSKNLGCMKL